MREMQIIKHKLNTTKNNMKLYVLSDMHLGDSGADISLIRKTIEFIKDTPDMYVILLGDVLNVALKNSKSDVYTEVLTVADAQKLAVELLTPIKDRIIAITPGNHENRVWREVGIDISLWLAEKLGLESVYRPHSVALNLRFGKASDRTQYSLNIFGQHGAYGGGRRMGSAINALEDLDGIVGNADIYVRAHTHQPVQGSRNVFMFNQNGNITKQTKYYFTAPAFLKYQGYGHDKGYKPTDSSPCYLNIRAYSERSGSRITKHFKIDKISV